MSQANCLKCLGRCEIPCLLDYGGGPHPENSPTCGGDSRVRIECPHCDGDGKKYVAQTRVY